jgi:hypothetical protein
MEYKKDLYFLDIYIILSKQRKTIQIKFLYSNLTYAALLHLTKLTYFGKSWYYIKSEIYKTGQEAKCVVDEY